MDGGGKFGKKNKKGKTRARVQALDDDGQAGVLCKLCNKELPILFFKNEEMIRKMPERNLNSFLLGMK